MTSREKGIIFALITVGILLTAGILAYTLLKDDKEEENNNTADWAGPYLDERNATADGVEDVVEANNLFGLDMLKELNEQEEGNIFISPYSIFTALSMTYEGARGQTATEMEDVLHLPGNQKERLGSFAKVQNDINRGSVEYELSTANAVWPAKGPDWNQGFLDTIEDFYDGKIEELDYASDPEACRQMINQWVENRTNDRIKDLIPKNTLDLFTYMVLTNAIYFKGEWIYEFNPDETEKAPFTTPEGEVQTDMMSMKLEDEQKVPYYSGENVKALELPYKGDNLSMVLVLPASGTIDQLIGDLDGELLQEIRKGLSPTNIEVRMPKLKLETKYELRSPLVELGMPTAFSTSADFSKMSPEGDEAYIDKVIHQTFLEVDEEGTEAAAATAVVMKNLSAGTMPEFNANRPFLFYIQQRSTGNILFLGSIEGPSSGE